jgi:hypothetical protein
VSLRASRAPAETATTAGVLSAGLIEQTAGRPVGRVLWLHTTDRWYFGDFLRHAPWLGWLLEEFPHARVEVASHPAYLPLYNDARFAAALDVTQLPTGGVDGYDLVVVPGPYRPSRFDESVPLVLATWDTGWQLRRHGRLAAGGAKAQLNYFRAAHPGTACGLTRAVGATPLVLADAEVEAMSAALDRALAGAGPVVVYNPTASTPFTRGTSIPKEVDNRLTPAQHAHVVRRLLTLLPDHALVVAASVKPGDAVNEHAIRKVAELAGRSRVVDMYALAQGSVTTIRGFAVLLSCPRVCSTVGSGTGTNTHLAQVTGTWALSFERGADQAMRANWARPGQFQMGSFRWRNPGDRAAVHVMDFAELTSASLDCAAEAFVCHHSLAHPGAGARLFTAGSPARILDAVAIGDWAGQPGAALHAAGLVLDAMTGPARAHYADFADEAAYLRQVHAMPGRGLGTIKTALGADDDGVRQTAMALWEDSNLDKLLRMLAGAR